MADITTQKHMNFKEIAAYSLGLFGYCSSRYSDSDCKNCFCSF